MSRATRLIAASAAVAALAIPASAAAAPTCTYDAATDTVQLQLDSPAPNGAYTLSRVGAFIAVRNGLPSATPRLCPGATVVNTELIRVLGTPQRDRFIVSLAGGPFAPGRSVEPGGLPEIEMEVRLGGPATRDVFEVRGSERTDLIRSGANGPRLDVTLNADADEDIRVDGALKLVRFFGFGDADVLAAGGLALGIAPWPGDVIVHGGPGDDTVGGGSGNDTLFGELGTDLYLGGAGRDTIVADDGNPETLDTGPGADSVTRDPFDTVI
jgi:hypothetical protein